MPAPNRQVLVSPWAVSSLWWMDDTRWLWANDRPYGPLTDDEVLAKYGDEAFRRRDLLRASDDRSFDPYKAELIGRRVRDALVNAGWDVVTDDVRRFVVRSAKGSLEVHGPRAGILQATGIGEELSLNRVDHAEQWLLSVGVPGDASPEVNEIMSRGAFPIGSTTEE